MASEQTQQLVDRIPDEQEVRTRLSQNLQEAAFLRALLRLAKKKPTDTKSSEREAALA